MYVAIYCYAVDEPVQKVIFGPDNLGKEFEFGDMYEGFMSAKSFDTREAAQQWLDTPSNFWGDGLEPTSEEDDD